MASNEDIENKGDLAAQEQQQQRGGWRRPPMTTFEQEPTTNRNFSYEDLEEKEAVMNDRAEFLDTPRCRGVIEWINCLLCDALLLITEVAVNMWLAFSLYNVGLVAEYRAIIVILVLPSIFNPAIWLGIRKNYKISGAFVFALLMVGLPSPLLVYLWHLYLSLFASLREAETSKLLSNSFRMVHACICSMPLMIINLSTLINQLRVDGLEDYAFDIQELKKHMTEVHMHAPAFILSFISFVRAACLFNERETMTMLFGIVALPMTMLTSLCRILILAIVIAFIEPEWTTILFIGLVLANVVLLWSCRKRTKLIQGYVVQPATSASLNADDLNQSPSTMCSAPGSQQCLSSGCCNTNAIQSMPTNKSGKYVLTRSPSLSEPGQSCWTNMSNYILLSFASIVLPCGYSNDIKMYHPRIKGGLYIILNYLVNMTILGVTLGYTILHRIPNDIHGFTISNPSINVLVPSSKLIVETGGMDINVKLPDQKINLASMPSVNASFNTESSDKFHAILLPVILAALCLPFTIMRCAMMELDCFVTRRKQLGHDFDDFLVMQSSKNPRKGLANNRRLRNNDDVWSLRDILAKNVESKELKCRLYTALCCSVGGIMVMTTFIMLMGALVFMCL